MREGRLLREVWGGGGGAWAGRTRCDRPFGTRSTVNAAAFFAIFFRFVDQQEIDTWTVFRTFSRHNLQQSQGVS